MLSNYNYNKISDKHTFVLNDVDLGIINSIRRIILSEIPVVGFYGEDEPTIKIFNNTGPLHNEFMIHRIGLIPLNISEEITEDYEDGDYEFYLNVENKSNKTINITTANFTGTYKEKELTKEELNKIFPPNNITKSHILITRLRPSEHLNLKATAIKRTGKLNASFSPVSLSNFYFIEDTTEIKEGVLERERNYVKNKYGDPIKIEFQIESVNGLSYKYLFRKSLDIIIDKLETLIEKLVNKEIPIEPVQSCKNSFNFQIDNEDDTLGNLIQSLLHNKYIRENNKFKNFDCSYVGYICPHPLISQLIIRFSLSTDDISIYEKFFIENCKEIIKKIEELKTEWNNFTKQYVA
jgi:DNA-directed RNA polymerase subunit L